MPTIPSRLPQAPLGTQNNTASNPNLKLGRIAPQQVVLIKGPTLATEVFDDDVDPNTSRALNNIQQNTASGTERSSALPFGDGHLIQEQHLAAGDNVLQHHLGQKALGYFIGRTVWDGAAGVVYFVPNAAQNLDASQFILHATQPGYFDIWVYR